MNTKKSFEGWAIEEFKELPLRKWRENIGEIDRLIILPTEEMHDSGFRCMDFVAVQKNIPTFRLSGCSDVLHLGGIGGINNKLDNIKREVPRVAWSIDCLPISGLLSVFCDKTLIAGDALSSFELFYK